MRKYELACVLDPQIGDAQFDKVVEKYESLLTSNGAEIAHIDRWGLRKMAYTSINLKRRQQGYYVLFQYTAGTDLLALVEAAIKLDETVLRHLVTSVKREFLRIPQLAPDTVVEDSMVQRGGYRSGGPGGPRRDGPPRRDRDGDSDGERGGPDYSRRDQDSGLDGGENAEKTVDVDSGADEDGAEDMKA